ncbi:MAG: ATP-grasp domain-containing protein [Candidatus Aminicenantes bacterium]|nr:ATP-grasp domain-containing protein [Candidatus Aminicenantes bacterium]NIM79997.1 ATP-grasp domain-containing protein [Candidatus Aminicenantes bacterium]NIN19351.1 ATP-grasp domain-containing protein [Candidatus Aminicenantes bacterium]NIN43250.1 ATP-grasp domain-containing protein [Candidatus Aminicenantes bacterium]NIN85992.1 ATP-grasp domain-containing protein [Candidatus Aminicenantes bacterium]
MKVAIVYNRESKNVINLFGRPNQEKIGNKTINRILNALKKGKHQAIALEGDKELIGHLEEFMPKVLKGERPGIVFNISYGIQGEARYTHVPSILEMVGIPYVASGPMAHSLALDKVVSKTIFRQFGLPTADFAVLNDPDFPTPDLAYPLIVKPKNEAVSFGIRVVHNEQELREAAQVIFDRFSQPVLVEQYIDGREINVGLLGNDPPEAFPPAEIVFGESGPKIYSHEDKTRSSGREVKVECPANLPEEKAQEARELARKAFQVLGCRDCARVDMRMDSNGNFYILEINSLPSLGEHGSYTHAAEAVGLDYVALVNRLVEVAVARYFGTPKPPPIDEKKKEPEEQIFQFLTQRREQVEKRLREWTRRTSRTSDPVGIREAVKELQKTLENFKLKPVDRFTDERAVWTWETKKGMKGGTLLIGHLDVPIQQEIPVQGFRRIPDRLYGEGIGCSRGPLVMMEFALGALRSIRRLRHLPIGVLYYMDEGQDTRYSREIIQAAAKEAKQVLILRPGTPPNCMVIQRRGLIRYRLVVEGEALRLGQPGKRPDAARWTNNKIEKMISLSSRKEQVAIGLIDFTMQRYPLRLPHLCQAVLLLNYLDKTTAQQAEKDMRNILGKEGYRWTLEKISERPPMKEKRKNQHLFKRISQLAQELEIPLDKKTSLWPSAAGLVPDKVDVICGIGPVAQDLYTPHESINRISLLQRTLLLTQFLITENKKEKK